MASTFASRAGGGAGLAHRRPSLLVSLAFAAAGWVSVAGCGSSNEKSDADPGGDADGGADTALPENPSFETDVKPITTLHCTRCHGGGGELNPSDYGTPPNGFFDQYDDPPDCVVTFDGAGLPHACRGATCPTPDEATVFVCRGLRYYTMPVGNPVLLNYFPLAMPPPPAPRPAQREIDVIERWAETPLP